MEELQRRCSVAVTTRLANCMLCPLRVGKKSIRNSYMHMTIEHVHEYMCMYCVRAGWCNMQTVAGRRPKASEAEARRAHPTRRNS